LESDFYYVLIVDRRDSDRSQWVRVDRNIDLIYEDLEQMLGEYYIHKYCIVDNCNFNIDVVFPTDTAIEYISDLALALANSNLIRAYVTVNSHLVLEQVPIAKICDLAEKDCCGFHKSFRHFMKDLWLKNGNLQKCESIGLSEEWLNWNAIEYDYKREDYSVYDCPSGYCYVFKNNPIVLNPCSIVNG